MLEPAEAPQNHTSSSAFLRRLTGDKSELLIRPAGWEMEEGELWDDLFDAISQEWRATYTGIMQKAFSFDTWVGDFVSLGFHSRALCEFERILRSLFAEFGRKIIHGIMENETVGTIVELLLLGDVQYYSAVKTATVYQGTTSGAQNQRSADVDNGGSGGEPPRSDGLSRIRQKSESDDGERPEDDRPQTIQAEDESQKALVYPAWLLQLHELAQEKSVELVFSNSDIKQSEQGRFLLPFTESNNSLAQPTTLAYHGSDVSPHSLLSYVSSFLNNGVLALPFRRGYFCVMRAAYYTNSLAYARIWPVIKNNLRGWRQLSSLPAPSVIIVVSEPSIEAVRGQSGKFTTTIIPQDRLDTAAEVIPSFSPLTAEQYATATKTSKRTGRATHKDYPGISACDFIISPLPTQTLNVIHSSACSGTAVAGHNDISSISILTAATDAAVNYMTQCITKIIVLGWGEGNLGASEKVDFGSAGIRDGESQYD